MNGVYIHSDGNRSGKTALAVTLASLLRGEGASIAVVKVVGRTDAGEPDRDPIIYRDLLGQTGEPSLIAVETDRPISDTLGAVVDSCNEAAGSADVLIIEGSSDIESEAARQLADALDVGVVGVTTHVHGKDARALSPWPGVFGERLIGVVVNGRTRYQGTEAAGSFVPAIRALGMEALGVVPEDRLLLSSTIDQVVEHLGGRYLQGEEYGSRLIEHFLVGGMGLDRGTLYFGIHTTNKAVIVRGDRPDIQMAALHTPTSCLIVTNGTEPVEYITHEADLEDVPVAVVDASTLDTMEAVGGLQDNAAFDHPEKVERFSALLRENVALSAVFGRLGVGAAA